MGHGSSSVVLSSVSIRITCDCSKCVAASPDFQRWDSGGLIWAHTSVLTQRFEELQGRRELLGSGFHYPKNSLSCLLRIQILGPPAPTGSDSNRGAWASLALKVLQVIPMIREILLAQCVSKCGPQTRSISTTWVLVRNTGSGVPG